MWCIKQGNNLYKDWLDVETDHMSIFEGDLELERNWLMQMGEGAASSGINILYCMAYCRHMLQSVEIKNVVSMRASDDYQAGNDQWDIGLTSAWIYALGLAPFKDNFWTTENQPGNPLYGNSTETHPKLEAAMATLSTGIVGFSDKIGHTNMDLINMSIMPNGKILKPSRPLVVPDFLVWELNANGHSDGISEYETWSQIGNHKFGIILSYNPKKLKQPKRNLRNYQFQKDSKLDFMAASFSRESNLIDGKLIHLQKWTDDTLLDNSKKDAILLVSLFL